MTGHRNRLAVMNQSFENWQNRCNACRRHLEALGDAGFKLLDDLRRVENSLLYGEVEGPLADIEQKLSVLLRPRMVTQLSAGQP